MQNEKKQQQQPRGSTSKINGHVILPDINMSLIDISFKPGQGDKRNGGTTHRISTFEQFFPSGEMTVTEVTNAVMYHGPSSQRFNPIASELADTEMHGPVIVVPKNVPADTRNTINSIRKRKCAEQAPPRRVRRPIDIYAAEFQKDRRLLLQAQGQKVVFEELIRLTHESWKAVTPEEKKSYEDQSAADKERYDREMIEYNRKNPKPPKKARPAHAFYALHTKEYPETEHALWNKVPEDAKSVFRQKALDDVQRYEQELETYKEFCERNHIEFNIESKVGKPKTSASRTKVSKTKRTDQADEPGAEPSEIKKRRPRKRATEKKEAAHTTPAVE